MRPALVLLALSLVGAIRVAPVGAIRVAPPPPGMLEPAAGRFLVATPVIQGSVFERSVVFLLQHDETGALGLIVNRRTETPVTELFPEFGATLGALHLGGPVEPATIRVLLRAHEPPDKAYQVTGDVFLTRDEATLRDAAALPDAGRRVRVYAGYAGWGAGQLEREIERGQWWVSRAPPGPIFGNAPDSLWERFMREWIGVTAGVARDGGRG